MDNQTRSNSFALVDISSLVIFRCVLLCAIVVVERHIITTDTLLLPSP